MLSNAKIFKIERKDMRFDHVPERIQNKTCQELLDILEELLKKKQLPARGIETGTLPDTEWIIRIIKHIDP